MKNLLLLFGLFLSLNTAFAQNVYFNYQGLIMDGAGVYANKNARVDVRLDGQSESHIVYTSKQGIYNIEVGRQGLDLQAIDWDNFNGKIEVEVTLDNGDKFQMESNLNYVPFAIYANEVEWSGIIKMPDGFQDGIDHVNDADSDSQNELQQLSLDQTNLELSDGGGSVDLSDLYAAGPGIEISNSEIINDGITQIRVDQSGQNPRLLWSGPNISEQGVDLASGLSPWERKIINQESGLETIAEIIHIRESNQSRDPVLVLSPDEGISFENVGNMLYQPGRVSTSNTGAYFELDNFGLEYREQLSGNSTYYGRGRLGMGCDNQGSGCITEMNVDRISLSNKAILGTEVFGEQGTLLLEGSDGSLNVRIGEGNTGMAYMGFFDDNSHNQIDLGLSSNRWAYGVWKGSNEEQNVVISTLNNAPNNGWLGLQDNFGEDKIRTYAHWDNYGALIAFGANGNRNIALTTLADRPNNGYVAIYDQNDQRQVSLYVSSTGRGEIYADYISKGSGSFKIDHPTDPENKYLYHSFVESPDMMNMYNGNIITDDSGIAIVQLPDWFEALNMDFRYQLTTIGSFSRVMISKEISGNQFEIRSEEPNVSVSWQVTGIRNDPYARENRIQVEVDKSPENVGRYLHPESYGKNPQTHGLKSDTDDKAVHSASSDESK